MVHAGENDPLLRDLDLSRLQIPTPPPAEAPQEPDRTLASGWDRLPASLRDVEFPDQEEVAEMVLPAGPLLVVANPPRVSDAYQQIAEALEATGLTPVPPLVLVLHADDNVSLGCRVEGEIKGPLPMGVSVSPQPARRLLVTRVDVSQATRRDPALPAATGHLRRETAARGLLAPSRELFLLPGSGHTTLLGLPVNAP